MKTLRLISRFFLRFRYPVSFPEDVAKALGIPLSNFMTFSELVKELTRPSCKPTTLIKFMPRTKAEKAFQGAQRVERFRQNTLFSYYFNEGWLEFALVFDEESKLRRVYVQHKQIEQDEGIELQLPRET